MEFILLHHHHHHQDARLGRIFVLYMGQTKQNKQKVLCVFVVLFSSNITRIDDDDDDYRNKIQSYTQESKNVDDKRFEIKKENGKAAYTNTTHKQQRLLL